MRYRQRAPLLHFVAQPSPLGRVAAHSAWLMPLWFPHFSTIEAETLVEPRAFLTVDWTE